MKEAIRGYLKELLLSLYIRCLDKKELEELLEFMKENASPISLD